MTPEEADKEQQWLGMDGATAWHLIERHADNWDDIGAMMEAWVNIVIGYGVSLAAQLFIFPMYGIHIPIQDNLMIGVWFTAVSLARSYCIRRVFNDRLKSKMRVR